MGDITLSSFGGVILGEQVMGPLSPCPSSSTNYWGDYDDLQTIGYGVGSGSTAGVATWIGTFGDSSQGCQFDWAFTSFHLHVSNVVYQ